MFCCCLLQSFIYLILYNLLVQLEAKALKERLGNKTDFIEMKKQLRQKHTNTCSQRGSRVTECPEGIPMWEEHGRAMQQNDVCSQPSVYFLKWAAQNLRLWNTAGDASNNACLQSQTDTHSQLCCGSEKSQVYGPDNLFASRSPSRWSS